MESHYMSQQLADRADAVQRWIEADAERVERELRQLLIKHKWNSIDLHYDGQGALMASIRRIMGLRLSYHPMLPPRMGVEDDRGSVW